MMRSFGMKEKSKRRSERNRPNEFGRPSFKRKKKPPREMDKKTLSELSKLMAYILRHDKKLEFQVDLDKNCYAEIDQLVKAIASTDRWSWVNRKHIEEVAAKSFYHGKKRFAIKGDKIKPTYRVTRKCPSTPKHPPNEYYVITAKHSGKCLDVGGKSKDNGANIIQYDYYGGDNQKWKLYPVGNGYFRIIAKHSGKCLDVGSKSKDNGASIIQYDYRGGDNQKWKLYPVGNGYSRISAKHSGKCLDVGGKSKDNRANIIQYHYWGGDNQQWKLESALEIEPKNARVWSHKGYDLNNLGRYEEAITCFDKALEIDPKYARAWRNKGYALEKLERYVEVLACFNNALEIDSKNARAWSHKGYALNNIGRYEEAITCLDKALGLNSRYAHAWSHKGYALSNLGRYEEAITCFDKALEINPLFEWALTKKNSAEEKQSAAIEIKRGYEVLQNNDLRFGIRITNNTGYAIMDVKTILDYPITLFSLKGNEIQTLANINPNGERTAEYLLTPLGCIHNEKIDVTILYKDHTGKKQTVQMHPKEVHCVYPFLKGKAMREGEFAEFSKTYEHIQEGSSFSGISVTELAVFIKESCAHRLYVISEHEIETTKIVYLAGESIGEKACYLLTAVIQPHKNVTQVLLRAYSDKPYGLHGFLNEIANSIRHLVVSVQSAKEIGIIENKRVINIIDTVMQRVNFGWSDTEATSVNIEGSVVQRTEVCSIKRCPDCGKEVQSDEKFCNECGSMLE